MTMLSSSSSTTTILNACENKAYINFTFILPSLLMKVAKYNNTSPIGV